jgi:hypothetical protein
MPRVILPRGESISFSGKEGSVRVSFPMIRALGNHCRAWSRHIEQQEESAYPGCCTKLRPEHSDELR